MDDALVNNELPTEYSFEQNKYNNELEKNLSVNIKADTSLVDVSKDENIALFCDDAKELKNINYRPKILPPDPGSSDEEDANAACFQSKHRKILRMRPYTTSSGIEKRVSRLVGRNSNIDLYEFQKTTTSKQLFQNTLDSSGAVAKQKCRDYEELGYCLLGNNCLLLHGTNSIVVEKFSSFVPQITHPVEISSHFFSQSQCQLNLPNQARPRFRTSSFLVRKIPSNCNNIFKINEYFGQFGEIKHIQVAFDGPDTALVTYEEIESATLAFRSKKPIFDNRFVSLKWYNFENDTNKAMSSIIVNNINSLSTLETTNQVSYRTQDRSNFTKTYNFSVPSVHNSRPSSLSRKARHTARQTKNEKLLCLKTDLYLKLSEQLRLVLLKAQSTLDEEVRRELMKKVDDVQESLAETRRTLMELHKKVQCKPGNVDLNILELNQA